MSEAELGSATNQYLWRRLIAPIDGGVGIDGRKDEGATGDLLREIRSQRKAILRADQKALIGEEVTGEQEWTWSMLMEAACDYLADHGKDLEPATVFLEASARTLGLIGFAQSTTIVADLVEQYWDAGLYPHEDEEDGVDARFQPISGLSGGSGDKDGPLVATLRQMAVAGDPVHGELRHIDRVTANNLAVSAPTSARRDAALTEAQAVLDAMDTTARSIPRKQLDCALAHLVNAEAAWRRMVCFISEQSKPRMPAASRVSDELGAMRKWLEGLITKLPAQSSERLTTTPPVGVTLPETPAGLAHSPPTLGLIPSIARREDALYAIMAAASFFERTEPLSPIGLALREIDRRARMNFNELLSELIPEKSTREAYYWRAGINPDVGNPSNILPDSNTGGW